MGTSGTSIKIHDRVLIHIKNVSEKYKQARE